MKPAAFEYRAPDTVEEVLDLIGSRSQDASLLAGGQSLVPMMSMRVARPELVVDLNRAPGLDGVERFDGVVRIGGMARQRAVELQPEIRRELPLLPAALSHVAHVAIRTRGTIGGSLAHADPSAELPAVVAVLGGSLRLRSRSGQRAVAARDFFIAPLITALEPGELIEAVELPLPPSGTGWAFLEMARTHGAFAMAGVAALVGLDPSGGVERAGVALFGVRGTPLVLDWLEDMLRGQALRNGALEEVGARLAASLEPLGDVHASAGYRRRVAVTLTLRALREANERAGRSNGVPGR
jgi:aerobic carbon-monoxide dehydrogenase medium subunit